VVPRGGTDTRTRAALYCGRCVVFVLVNGEDVVDSESRTIRRTGPCGVKSGAAGFNAATLVKWVKGMFGTKEVDVCRDPSWNRRTRTWMGLVVGNFAASENQAHLARMRLCARSCFKTGTGGRRYLAQKLLCAQSRSSGPAVSASCAAQPFEMKVEQPNVACERRRNRWRGASVLLLSIISQRCEQRIVWCCVQLHRNNTLAGAEQDSMQLQAVTVPVERVRTRVRLSP
jgi:hypothetical protein